MNIYDFIAGKFKKPEHNKSCEDNHCECNNDIQNNNIQNENICVHDPASKNSSLKQVPKRYLVHPEISDWYCPYCHEVFRYKKEGSTFVLVTDDKVD